MATIDVGKIKFTWKGAFATGTTYEKDDVVSYASSSWVYVNAASKTGTAAGAPSASNSSHWDIMASGSNPLTTQGDILTHDGTSTIRLARGSAGQVLTVSGNDVTFANIDGGMSGMKLLLPNYDQVDSPSASTTYGASGSRAWLADYANNWIPESGIPNPSMGPVMFNDNRQYGSYRSTVYLNQNHEVVVWGTDTYYWGGASAGNKHKGGTSLAISPEFGGLLEGEYFVRIWAEYKSIWCLTNKGSVFFAGYNGYGQAGVGDTVNRHALVRIPGFGPNETHAGTGCRVVGLHITSGGDGYPNYHRCFAIDENLRLYAWGYGASNALGTGTTSNQSRPQLIDQVTNVVQVQSGYVSSACVDTSGDIYFTGTNQNGHFGDGTTTARTTFTQSTAASNVYQFNINTNVYYTSSWTYNGTSHYLNTSGELYGAGYNGNGQIGDGTQTTNNGWQRAGASLTFSSFRVTGMSRDASVAALSGTPGSAGTNLYIYGYNGTGVCATGNTTDVNAPAQPSTTTLYTNTSASTDTEAAPTQTAVSFPVTDIAKMWPARGISGQSTWQFYFEDGDGNIWKTGYNSNTEYYQNLTNNVTLNNARLDVSGWSTPETTTNGYFWYGETQRRVIAFQGQGYSYNSQARQYAYMSDGTIFAIGYNGQGQLDTGDNWVGAWTQIN